MEDWQRMALYTELRLEDLRQQSVLAHLAGNARRNISWLLVATAALFLGLAPWAGR
jgi:hypothetical protein